MAALLALGEDDRAIGAVEAHRGGFDVVELLGEQELHLALGVGGGDEREELRGRVAAARAPRGDWPSH